MSNATQALSGPSFLRTVVVPVMAVTAVALLLLFLKINFAIYGFRHPTPFVVASGLIANLLSLEAGLVAAALSIPLCNLLFMSGKYAFSTPSPDELLCYGCMLLLIAVIGRRNQKNQASEPQRIAGRNAFKISEAALGFRPGDSVIVEPRDTYQEGDKVLVVHTIGDETVWTLHQIAEARDGDYAMQPANGSTALIRAGDSYARIVGAVDGHYTRIN